MTPTATCLEKPPSSPTTATTVDPGAFIDPVHPQSWSRQMRAMLEAGHYREAYELLSQKVPYIENQLRYFAQTLDGTENHWSLIHARLAGMIDEGRPLRILDVGCAVGCHAIQFAREGHQTWGVDILPDMIARGRELSESLGLRERTHLQTGDIRRLPDYFQAGFFDCAVASDIFEHLDDAALLDVLAGLRRVVRPGGRVVIQTSPGRFYYWFEPDRQRLLRLLTPLAWLPDRVFSTYVRGLDRLLFQRLRHEPPSFYRHENGHINCMDPVHLRGLLERAGLSRIRVFAEHTHPGFKDEACMRTPRLRNLFAKKTIACRNVYGQATVTGS